MAKIEKNIKNVNLMKSALVFFFPDGKVLSIDKIKGKKIHFEYLNVLSKSEPYFKKLLLDLVGEHLDWDHWYKNPMLFLNEIVPIFTKNGCAVYMNLTPDVIQETYAALMLMPQELSKTLTKLFLNNEKVFDGIIFYDIAIYNEKSGILEPTIDNVSEESNSQELFAIVKSLNMVSTKRRKRAD